MTYQIGQKVLFKGFSYDEGKTFTRPKFSSEFFTIAGLQSSFGYFDIHDVLRDIVVPVHPYEIMPVEENFKLEDFL